MGVRRNHETRQVELEGLSVEVVRKPIRRLNLTVHAPDGRVRVAVPLRASDAGVREFVLSRRTWIERHQTRIRARAAAAEPAPEFITGENHLYLGESYRLNVIEKTSGGSERTGPGSRCGAILLGNPPEIHLTVRPGASKADREKALFQWYRDELLGLIPSVLARWESVIGVEVMEWGIKRMKTKWGTCNPRARRIWINLELIKKPMRCLDYLMAHELTHILEPSHNARFHSFMDRFLPDWRLHRNELKKTDLK